MKKHLKIFTIVICTFALVLALVACNPECTEHVDEDGDGECDVCLYEQQGGQVQDKPSDAPAINCGASLNAGAIEISLAIMGAAFILAMRKKSKKD